MLVKFDSDAGSFTMFGEDAIKLLKLMGHSGTIPSAILVEDVPAALARLQAAMRTEGADPAPAPGQTPEDDKKEPPVSLRQRAYPLIDLLTRAVERGDAVTWS
jgi:Domain of unknown function (DUF1840)